VFYPPQQYVRENNCHKVDQRWVELVVLSMTKPPVLKTLHLLGNIDPSWATSAVSAARGSQSPAGNEVWKRVFIYLGDSSCTASPLDCWNWKLQSFVCNHFQGYRTGSNLYCRKLFWRFERIILGVFSLHKLFYDTCICRTPSLYR